MALLESAIGGIAATIFETALRAGGAAYNQIKTAYKTTQDHQRVITAANTYAERYAKRHGQIRVMPGLMKEPLPLDEIYTAVKLLDDDSIHYFWGVDDLEDTYRRLGRRSLGAQEGERRDGMQVANERQFLMVLGGPGIGKSTFLRKIGLEALKKQGQITRPYIPVLLELKEFQAETIDLKQKIAAEFEICGFPEATTFTELSLAQGKLLVLLDGLDEVPSRNLNRVIEHIEDFVDAHDQNTFVASCRIAAYRNNPGTCFQRFTDVTLAEFDDPQIEQFIQRWFRSELDQQACTAEKYWQLLQKNENQATKELAHTPLLLTFLCLIYDREQALPTQRSTLYGKALNILLAEWAAQKRLDQAPIYEGFHPDLEKLLLAEIAYTSFKHDQLFFLRDDITQRISAFLADTLDAPKHLDDAAVLRAIEHQQGILVERATDVYSFSHLTLQEYLTALHIKESRLEAALIEQHLTDERWREVFLLLAGLSGNQAIDLLAAIETQTRTALAGHPKLVNLVRWAETSTAGSSGAYSPIAKRAAAIAITIDIIIAITNHFVIIDASNTAVDLVKTLASDVHLIKAIATARTIARAITIEVDIANVYTSIFVSFKWQELPDHLQCLCKTLPDSKDSLSVWQTWTNELETLWLDTLGLEKGSITFTQVEAEVLNDYLYATELLLRCKAAAVRIPKQAWAELETRLLTI